MQTDVAEAFEPAAPGRGGSSSMPQKRNPTAAAAALSAATIAPQLAATILSALVQHEHERATGAWQAEWPTFPALLLVASGALGNIVEISEGLEVDAERMRANLESTGGLVMAEAVSMALAARLGKQEAHAIIAEASKKAIAEKKNLEEVLTADARVRAHLQPADLEKLFEPLFYQGMSQIFIERLVASSQPRTRR